MSDSIIIIDINIEHREFSSIGFKNEVTSARSLLEKRFSSLVLDLVDHIFSFRPLDEGDFEKVIKKEINNFIRILKEKEIEVFFEEDIVDYLKSKTYESGFGIKSVRKIIIKEIGSLLINEMIVKKLKK